MAAERLGESGDGMTKEFRQDRRAAADNTDNDLGVPEQIFKLA